MEQRIDQDFSSLSPEIKNPDLLLEWQAKKILKLYDLSTYEGKLQAVGSLWGRYYPTGDIAKLIGCHKSHLYELAHKLGLRMPGRNYRRYKCKICGGIFSPSLTKVRIQKKTRGQKCNKCSDKNLDLYVKRQRLAYFLGLKLDLSWEEIAKRANYRTNFLAVIGAKKYALKFGFSWPIPGRRSAALKRAWAKRKENNNGK